MDFSRQFLLLVTIWVHSIIPDVDAVNEMASTCGLSKVFSHISTSSSMIVRPSRNATLGDWPWMGALYSFNPAFNLFLFKCGSFLISDLWVITAGHCLDSGRLEKLAFIRFGTVDNGVRYWDPKHQIDRLIDKVILHPEFNRTIVRNDIALIRLKHPVPFSDYVRPICLARDTQFGDERYDGARVYISGWGQPSENYIKLICLAPFGDDRYDGAHGYPSGWGPDVCDPQSSMLKDAAHIVTNRRKCAEEYIQLGKHQIIDETITCAGITGSAVCFGDSGGPLMFLNPRDNRLYAMGIISSGIRCNPGFPDVYTRIGHYMPWILETIRANQY